MFLWKAWTQSGRESSKIDEVTWKTYAELTSDHYAELNEEVVDKENKGERNDCPVKQEERMVHHVNPPCRLQFFVQRSVSRKIVNLIVVKLIEPKDHKGSRKKHK